MEHPIKRLLLLLDLTKPESEASLHKLGLALLSKYFLLQ